MMTAQLVEKTTGALADKYRLAIVLELGKRESMAFADVQELTGLSQPCTSHHLKVLNESGLVLTQKTGRCVQVRLNREALRGLSAFLGELG
ncbi:metalloregulator ArsR/SmtB family transcription factor [Hymenobacter koreensis]|uniref:HTH arsR-type domain-containing protein n=1 Tax=Hymenobacter koreensis TaxID=1084523 RepID=A0ABP8JFD4_9BACT